MDASVIQNIFFKELTSDLIILNQLTESKEYQKIYEFAHKYKLRLHFLEYNQCLHFCNQIVDAFKKDKFSLQIELANKLNSKLAAINNSN